MLLIENGLIEIEFTHDGKKHLLTSDIENVRELLEVYCELNELNRKNVHVMKKIPCNTCSYC